MFKLQNNIQKKTIIINKNKNIFFFNKKNIFLLDLYNIMDINYTGKTYKWKIKINFFKFIFNKAHKTNFFLNKNIFFKKLSKNKIRLFLQSKINYFILKNLIFKIRKYNIFTQRGLKIKNNIILKKKGKISTYK